MSRRAAVRTAWLGWALVLILQISYTALHALAGRSTIGDRGLGTFVAALAVFQIFATVGAVVASHRPENAIGWLFLATAGLVSLANLGGGYAELAVRRSLGGAVVAVTALNSSRTGACPRRAGGRPAGSSVSCSRRPRS